MGRHVDQLAQRCSDSEIALANIRNSVSTWLFTFLLNIWYNKNSSAMILPGEHSGRSTGTRCWCLTVSVPMYLLVVLMMYVDGVSAGIDDPDEYRQFVADMKADIKAGRAASFSPSNTGAQPRLTASVRLDPQVSVPAADTGRHQHQRQRGATRDDSVKSLKVDRFAVTNGDFMAFIQAKPRYQTEAEKRGYSWVFEGHVINMAAAYDQRVLPHPDGRPHWHAVRNASWHQPYGVGSSIAGKMNLPVVHVGYRDAFAFCVWANKRLPTETEWEHIARAEFNDTDYPWGGSAADVQRANYWQGSFPSENTLQDGYYSLSPVDAFPIQNSYGVYDMLGNVWEWTTTVYAPAGQLRDLNRPKYTAKGGSFLDQHVSISSRLALYPVYSAENVGFRCVEPVTPPPPPPVTVRDDIVERQVPAGRGRQATRHRLTETWSYKVKQAFMAIITGARGRPMRNEEL